MLVNDSYYKQAYDKAALGKSRSAVGDIQAAPSEDYKTALQRSRQKYSTSAHISYIRDLQSGDVLFIPSLEEGGVSDQAQPQYNPLEILGRSSPIFTYQSTGARELSFQTKLTDVSIVGLSSSPRYIMHQANFLRSLVYPDYRRGITYPPSRVLLVLGRWIKLVGIITECSVTWMPPYKDGFPQQADVSLGFSATPVQPFGRSEIREHGDSETLGGALGGTR